MSTETTTMPPSKMGNVVHPDPNISSSSSPMDDADDLPRNSSFSAYDPTRPSADGSPMMMSPWNQNPSPFSNKSPWSNYPENSNSQNAPRTGLIGSLVREEGHIYSLAARGGLLYTGSDSKNIRVWKDMKEFSAFKSSSGLVKAIVVAPGGAADGGRIFTGHQDGKIRVWRVDPKNPATHRRVGTMPTFFDIFKASIRPRNYVEVKRKRSAVWIKHTDAVSCMSMDEGAGLLYSGSWDRTFKAWRVGSKKCVDSVRAHDDAVNSVVSGPGGLVYTGSADGSVKVWRREQKGKAVVHVPARTLLSQECAVTALALVGSGSVLYCGSSDGLVNFWEVEKEEEMLHGGVLKGHRLAVLCLEAAGRLVISGSADKTICVWRREGSVHTCLSVLTGHSGPVKCLAVEEADKGSSEGERKWIVHSGSLDKSVKVWSVSETTPDWQRDGNFNWDSMPSAKYG